VKLRDYVAADDYFEAVKPDGEGTLHFVNGPVPVLANAYGGSMTWDLSRLGLTDGAFGETVGPTADSWQMTTGGTGWTVFSVPEDGLAALLRDGGSGTVIHDGLVSEVRGCGNYLIELGYIPDDGSGSGSQSTSGSGVECDPCGTESGSGEGCGITLVIPEPRVIGLGIFVEAYDPQSTVIPLTGGSDCVVGKVSGSSSGSASSSFSQSGSGVETVLTGWRVLRGLQEHIVQYRERWDCCEPDGPAVLVAKTPIIFVGKECAEIICGECPPSSGSGA
jgi:hypothetical protein